MEAEHKFSFMINEFFWVDETLIEHFYDATFENVGRMQRKSQKCLAETGCVDHDQRPSWQKHFPA